jgi:predicted MFS family arabinose efflux permease
MLAVQALLVASGSVITSRIPRVEPRPDAERPKFDLRDLADGLREVARRPRLRVPAAMVVAVGVLFIGPFIVLFPLLVRDFYQGGVARLSLVLMLFPVGTIVGSFVIRRIGIARKGRAALFALLCGAISIASIGTGVPFSALVALTTFWGLCGAVFINGSRTLFQEASPAEQRGRVLAVYQLGFMGGAPIGAVASGFLSSVIGLHATMVAAGGAMIAIVGALALFSDAGTMD